MVQTELKWLDMLLAEGSLDILQYLKTNKIGQFSQFLELRNKRTGKGFSPTTISARLDDLEKMNAVMTTAVRTKKRRVLGYQISETGLRILETAYEFEKRLSGIIAEKK